MAAKNEKTEQVAETPQEIIFTCKFCGEPKPFSELVVMRHYYPQVPACRSCARGAKKTDIVEELPVEEAAPEGEQAPSEPEK